jgi:hypothetical protein
MWLLLCAPVAQRAVMRQFDAIDEPSVAAKNIDQPLIAERQRPSGITIHLPNSWVSSVSELSRPLCYARDCGDMALRRVRACLDLIALTLHSRSACLQV